MTRDVLESTRAFTGNGSYSVHALFQDAEENVTLIPSMDDKQKINFIKKLLFGPTKLFIQSKSGLLTNNSLKRALIEEFGETINSAELHKQLQKRKMKRNETLFQYFKAIRNLTSHGYGLIDDASVINYCIEGIPDLTNNTILFYECKSISDFKEN